MKYRADAVRLRNRRTKIVATLGPASSDEATLGRLLDAGVNVVRLNMSHGEHAGHAANFHRVRALAEARGKAVGILADLCGPKIRVGKFAGGGIDLVTGQDVTLTVRDVQGEPGLIPSQYAGLAADVTVGQRIFLADGLYALEVLAVDGTEVRCRVTAGGRLTDKKGINLPDSLVGAPCLTEKDRIDAAFALELGVDFLALSFVRQASDIVELRELMEAQGRSAQIVAKIERPEALDNIDEILAVTDVIMVARGDLGVELPPEIVPVAQRDLLDRARAFHRPAIVATQMLESMVTSPRPTRAEVTDVAHSVASGADAVMLSAETAAGAYPVEAVAMMDRAAREQESYLWGQGQFDSLERARTETRPYSFGLSLARATSLLSRDLMVRAVVVLTQSGTSAAEVISARPAAPIVVLTPNEQARSCLALSWGALPFLVDDAVMDEPLPEVRRLVLELGLAEPGQTLLLVRGFHKDPAKSAPSVTLVSC